MLTESNIKKLFIKKLKRKKFKFDQLKRQKFIEIVNANFISQTGYVFYHNHHVTDENWYIKYYEPLLENKIDYVVNEIKKNPDTRKAYISLLDPRTYYGDEQICTIGMQLIYNKYDKRLDYIVYMRSNNACEYTMDSLWHCKIFQMIVSRLQNELDKDIITGYLYWNVGSFHVYEEDFKYLSDNTKIAKQIKKHIDSVNKSNLLKFYAKYIHESINE